MSYRTGILRRASEDAGGSPDLLTVGARSYLFPPPSPFLFGATQHSALALFSPAPTFRVLMELTPFSSPYVQISSRHQNSTPDGFSLEVPLEPPLSDIPKHVICATHVL